MVPSAAGGHQCGDPPRLSCLKRRACNENKNFGRGAALGLAPRIPTWPRRTPTRATCCTAAASAGRRRASATTRRSSSNPEQPEARYNLANLLEDMGDADRAIAEWDAGGHRVPEFADAHYNLGTALAREGSVARARVHLEKYLALDPEGDWATRARTLLTSLK